MKRLLIPLALLLCLVAPGTARATQAQQPPDTVQLYYLYEDLCASCEGATNAFDAAAARELVPLAEAYPYTIHRVNVFNKAGRAQYEALLSEMGLDTADITLPALIAGGRVFQGDETIEKNLREAFLVAAEDLYTHGQVYNPRTKQTGDALFDGYQAPQDAVTVVYFYRITCEECGKAAPVIDGLPKAVQAADGSEAPVHVIRINTRSGNNAERIAAFFDAYDVPDVARMVPIAFTAEAYFAGHEAIQTDLEDALRKTPPGFVFPASRE